MEWNDARDQGKYYWQMLAATAKAFNINLDTPVGDLPEEKLNIILYGSNGKEVQMKFNNGANRRTVMKTPFEGVIPNMMRRFRETHSDYIRNKIQEFMSDQPCPDCKGNRLRAESLAVTIDDKNIMEVTDWPVERSLPWIDRLMGEDTPLNERDIAISKEF